MTHAYEVIPTLRVEVNYDNILEHWWFRIRGTNISDCGYDSATNAFFAGYRRFVRHMKEDEKGNPFLKYIDPSDEPESAKIYI